MSKENILNKHINIIYIIGLILLIIKFSSKLLISFIDKNIFINLTITIIDGLFLIVFVILLLLTLKNFSKIKKEKFKIILMIISLLLGFCILDNISLPNKLEKKYINQVVGMIEKIKQEKKQKYVYKIEDLKKLDKSFSKSSYDLDINKKSYILNLGNKIRVCITDGKNVISGEEDNLKYEKSILEDCEFNLSYDEMEFYIKSRLKDKYNNDFEVLNCERPNTPIPFSKVEFIKCSVKEYNKNDEFKIILDEETLEFNDTYL